MLTLGQRISEAIKLAGILQGDLAEQCGVTVQAVSGWIKKSTVKLEHLITTAEFTGVDFYWLCSGKGSPGGPVVENGEGSMLAIAEAKARYVVNGRIHTGLVSELLPDASTAVVWTVTEFLNDVNTGRISEKDLEILQPLFRKIRN